MYLLANWALSLLNLCGAHNNLTLPPVYMIYIIIPVESTPVYEYARPSPTHQAHIPFTAPCAWLTILDSPPVFRYILPLVPPLHPEAE